ncbi:protein MLN51 homolog [Macadamia integrifolia]|uniref:protein MLN51 homolog n=1 Tax=Macadamia integrifolia TaxID=60698 RepID=UPI001C5017D9|nr:protein MLN51 homolog [Macadamia integrifolia]XP_042490616.1 protein MLN51 homolog [Macadamia integrifolia]
MAVEGGEEVDYESDPEEAMLTLAMRRREASDDEEGDGEEKEKPLRKDLRPGTVSDGESEGEGGAPAYDDEESEEEEEEEVGEEEHEEEEVEETEEGEGEFEGRADVDAADFVVQVAAPGSVGDGGISSGEPSEFQNNNQNQVEDEKKENEPFAVPTAGAFYMHDDRFRDNGGGRRRTPGGRKLWESRDDRKWGHDKFEEMNSLETHYEDVRRKSKGHYRGRGKNRGMDHGFARRSRSRGYDNSSNQNRTSKAVRGRGPRRYEPPAKNNIEPPMNRNKHSGKAGQTTSNVSSGRVPANASSVQSDPVPPRKNVFASSLSSASPPFYPSGSSNQDISVPQKRDVPSGNGSRNLSPSGMEDNYSSPQSNALLRGKNVADPTGLDRLYIDESVCTVSGKPLSNLQMQASGTSHIITTQALHSRAQGRGVASPGQISYQPTPPLNQVRVSAQPSSVQLRPVQIPVQSLRASSQQLGQRAGGGSQASSPPKAASRNSPEPGESESPPGSSKSKSAIVGKGKGNIQSSGRGSFLYNGAQVIGATGTMGVVRGDQSFPATAALLPVMQFGGQHPGGIPAVGMALPGYVAQSQLGFGNSDMTWVPVLAGAAAGALGATYCSPYLGVDGGYCARPSGQASSLGPSGKETSPSKPNTVWRNPQRPELVNDEFGQRQNKPRRYSEMNFGQ